MSQPLETSSLEEQTSLSIKTLKGLFSKHKPSIVLTFGTSAFIMTLFACGESSQGLFESTKKETILLGEQFRSRIENYCDDKMNVIPLLHVSIARRYFLKAHKYFVGDNRPTPSNYFNYVGEKLADLLLEKLFDRPIWISINSKNE
ncbi:hypothetical protein ACFLTT_02225 [Chloroflexota bacterium]